MCLNCRAQQWERLRGGSCKSSFQFFSKGDVMMKLSFKAALMGMAMWALSATAQTSAIQVVVPFPAASPSSELARQMTAQLAIKLGQPVNVEYKPGGNSRVAQEHVRNAKPDGLTYFWATSAMVVEPVIADKPQDMGRDLMPLALSVRSSLIMVARPGLPQRSFQEVLASLRAGGKLSCGYGGGAMLLACSALKQINPEGVNVVGYQSSGLAVPDVVGDRLDVAFMLVEPTVKSLIASDKIRLLGRTHSGGSDPVLASATRLDSMLPALAIAPWHAWFAPVGTPPEQARRFVQAAQEVIMDAEMLKRFDDYDFRPQYITEPDFSRFLQAEYARYAQLLRTAK
jgi:tripartite-type tricarboxylate transporter receptor subunit TctC